ncbi:MAG: metal ABC transporter substrate-binding protein [Deltaproteobacteria bacterium]|jgi:ABC-type Zn uptake system ZnuABC Zn-binding protein ZnuA|nr:metal ABC transporter substrate-binding protein [Deltaproteobacteria bacterium]
MAKNILRPTIGKDTFLLSGLCLLLSVLVSILVLNTTQKAWAQADSSDSAPTIIVASYPAWLFTRYLSHGRDYFNVELLTNPETGCPHEFNPKPRDLERLTKTKTLVENGLNLEVYLDRALRVAPRDISIVDASEGVPTLILSYGRLTLRGEAPMADPLAPNPHIFLSPRLAGLMAQNIAKGLTLKDPAGESHYQERLASFQKDMDALSADLLSFKRTRRGYKVVVSHGFMDYLAQDMGITILADIEPAPEVAPSPARLKALTETILAERVSAILVEPHADLRIAQTLGAETGIPVAVIDPATSGSADPPIDYYQMVLRQDIITLSRLFPVNASAN